MHGRRLATTEEIVALAMPDSGEALDRLESWTTTHDIDLVRLDIGAEVTDDHVRRARETLAISVGGDGAFLEGVRAFAPYRVPLLGVNTGTLAFLARVDPRDLDAALTEILRGRASIHARQQYRVTAADLDTTGINEVFLQKHPPEERHGTKVGSLHVFVDEEYVGEYFGSGLIVSTPTGSTGRAYSNHGPIHFPHDNRTLQIVPHETISASADPIVVSRQSAVRVVLDDEFDIDVDGGRHYQTLEPGTVVHISGADRPAHVVRTSYDDPFITALVDKLGWSLRTLNADGPRDQLSVDAEPTDFRTQATRVAREAARSAGEPLRELHGQVEHVEYKTDKADIVTEADRQSEHIITTVIENEFPKHGIRSEESPAIPAENGFTWLIDPLDGTGNFAHGNPNYSVSIALLDGDDTPIIGVVYNPESDEMFHAVTDRGAYQDGRPIDPTDRDRLDESMLLSGHDPDGSFLQAFYHDTQGVRRLGSAALHLAYVAAGSADAVWEYDTYPWDVAAGLCLIREAGGTITDHRGDGYEIRLDDDGRQPLLASNGVLHRTLLDRLDQTSL
jgi:myo-inositol-1(or 4)-monophosphatase